MWHWDIFNCNNILEYFCILDLINCQDKWLILKIFKQISKIPNFWTVVQKLFAEKINNLLHHLKTMNTMPVYILNLVFRHVSTLVLSLNVVERIRSESM